MWRPLLLFIQGWETPRPPRCRPSAPTIPEVAAVAARAAVVGGQRRQSPLPPPFPPSSLSLSAHLPRAVGARRAAIDNGTGHDRAAVDGYRCRGPLRPNAAAASITPATPAAAAAASAASWAPTPLSFPAFPPLSPPNPTHRFRPP